MDQIVGPHALSGTCLVEGHASGELVWSDVPISFWGGVDAFTGVVIDRHHPLFGKSIAGKVLALPSGRGSCTGSSVMLELILNGHAPCALLFGEDEDILTLGVVIADDVFGRSLPVLCLGRENFDRLEGVGRVDVTGSTVRILDGLPADTGEDTGSTKKASLPDAAIVPGVALSAFDRACLDGDHGHAAAIAMRVILRMAALQGATSLIDVTRAHIDGCIYTGPASLRFARQLCDWGARVRIPTTLNAISVDQRNWRGQGQDPSFAEPAAGLAEAYLEMGARPSFTCAPYLLEAPPQEGEQIVWAESNAVVYANSVLGARTMKYPDYLDICIALTGRAPLAGCHLDIHRRPALRIDVDLKGPVDDSFFPLLGYHAGKLSPHAVPLLTGLEVLSPTPDDLKAFGAAFATTSGAPMFHVLGVTPEASAPGFAATLSPDLSVLAVTRADLQASWRELTSATDPKVDLVCLGNPHFSLDECRTLARLVEGRTRRDSVAVIVTCGRDTHEKAGREGLVEALARFGVRFVTDICWCTISEPIFPPDARTLMTNSGKYAHYGPALCGRPAHFGSLAACVEAACTGVADPALPDWLAA